MDVCNCTLEYSMNNTYIIDFVKWRQYYILFPSSLLSFSSVILLFIHLFVIHMWKYRSKSIYDYEFMIYYRLIVFEFHISTCPDPSFCELIRAHTTQYYGILRIKWHTIISKLMHPYEFDSGCSRKRDDNYWMSIWENGYFVLISNWYAGIMCLVFWLIQLLAMNLIGETVPYTIHNICLGWWVSEDALIPT